MALVRKAFLMILKPGYRAEYEKRHNPIWPELAGLLSDHGVKKYSIFLDPRTNYLFGYVEVESEERWDQIASDPVCRRWWTHMRELMETNEDASPLAFPLDEVFHLE